jgi:hypothetical protein
VLQQHRVVVEHLMPQEHLTQEVAVALVPTPAQAALADQE